MGRQEISNTASIAHVTSAVECHKSSLVVVFVVLLGIEMIFAGKNSWVVATSVPDPDPGIGRAMYYQWWQQQQEEKGQSHHILLTGGCLLFE